MKKNLMITLFGISCALTPLSAHAGDEYRQQLRTQIKAQVAAEDAIVAQNNPALIEKSINTCNELASTRSSAVSTGIMEAVTAVGGSIGAVAFSINSANGDEAMALGLSSTGTTVVGFDIGAAKDFYDGVVIALSFNDFTRLAFELGNDQEGLVTKSFTSSCLTSSQEACSDAIETLKRRAKLGTMCEGWLTQYKALQKANR